MTIIVQNYVESLTSKYSYWHRTLGVDQFFVPCHDVGVRETEGHPLLVNNSIRVVCSPSYDVGFIPHKDIALPQVLQLFALPRGGDDIENRLRAYRLKGLGLSVLNVPTTIWVLIRFGYVMGDQIAICIFRVEWKLIGQTIVALMDYIWLLNWDASYCFCQTIGTKFVVYSNYNSNNS